jgi:chromosome partitioning protein
VRALALANQKGGVGKTTTAIHLGHCLALAGKRVAIFDLDPQGNATLAVQEMKGGAALEPLVAVSDRLWILPSLGNERVVGPDEQADAERLDQLRKILEPNVDVLLLDCPPRMDAWGWAGLRLCDHVLVPVQAEFFAMHGLSRMLQTIELARGKGARGELMGVFISMFDYREEVAQEVRADLRANLGECLFDSVIVRDPEFIEAASHGLSLLDYNPLAKGARCYAALAREVMAFWSDVPRETRS